jgi:hypothetical protein
MRRKHAKSIKNKFNDLVPSHPPLMPWRYVLFKVNLYLMIWFNDKMMHFLNLGAGYLNMIL